MPPKRTQPKQPETKTSQPKQPEAKATQTISQNVVVNLAEAKSILRKKTRRRVRKPVQVKRTGTGGGFINYAQTQFRPVAPTYAQITLNPNIVLPATKQPLVRDTVAEVRNPLFDISDVTATTTLTKTVQPMMTMETPIEPVTTEPENPLIPETPTVEPATPEPNPLRSRRTKQEKEEAIAMGLEDPNPLRKNRAERSAIKRLQQQVAIQQSNIRENITSPLGKKIGEAFLREKTV